ncbi:hypothetical protein Bca101_022856 [Brassica carinata]
MSDKLNLKKRTLSKSQKWKVKKLEEYREKEFLSAKELRFVKSDMKWRNAETNALKLVFSLMKTNKPGREESSMKFSSKSIGYYILSLIFLLFFTLIEICVATHRSTFSKFRRAVLTSTFLFHDLRGKLGTLILKRLLKMVISLPPLFDFSLPSHAIGSIPVLNAPLVQTVYLYSSSDSHSLVGNPPASSSSSSQNHASTKPVIQEQPGVSAAALPKNRYSDTSNKEVTPKLPAVTESNDDEQSCEKPRRVMPKFAQVYRFIESVFDPNTSGHLQRLKQMDPINMETVLLLMRNLSVNLTIPEFAEQVKEVDIIIKQ